MKRLTFSGHQLILQLLISAIWSLTRCSGQSVFTDRSRRKFHNVSILLDKLLDDYDNSLRPDMGGPPLIVDIDIVIRSMGPISEADMTFSLDCYFRQTWRDARLQHQHSSSDALALSISMLKRIWKPDSYFYNGKQSYLHTITTPNKLVRLYPDGKILYSSRLTIKASCPMHLHNFPMDIQTCPLFVGSFAYTTKDVVYRWNEERQVIVDPNMKLSQFDLVSHPIGNYTLSAKSGEYSMLSVRFRLRRHTGSFLIQVYGPCILLVVLSWVSFWLNREATADRVSLGVMTILTMTFLGLEARDTLPKVAYPTALDYFIFLSYGFIFATIVQFAVVHYYTKIGFGEIYYEFINESKRNCSKAQLHPSSTCNKGQVNAPEIYSVDAQLASARKDETCIQLQSAGSCRNSPKREATNHRHPYPKVFGQQRDTIQMNSVSKIDQISRVVFPLLFLVINLFYWCTYIPNDP